MEVPMGGLFDGTCRLCGETYTGQGITSHLKRCLADHANQGALHHGLLVGVRADGFGGRYWFYMLVRPEASLFELDAHLRETWLESLGRPSAFEIEGIQYLNTLEAGEVEDDSPVQSMDTDVGAVVRPRTEFDYLYDLQHPDRFELVVYDPYPCPSSLVDDPEEADVVTVARNESDEAECATCGGDAVYICPVCAEADVEEGFYACETCRDEHDADLLPIVNSPRMGIGGFRG
jgi:hypothetical protein